ncbi:MAG: hypothetical protein H5T98_08025 [Syntrophomonadaceae bacterium]|nr:hypothetical protein [Syntrophomonadaceae bacterium]
MDIAAKLTNEEAQIARRVESYFKTSNMSLREKLFNAALIAQYELEGHYFCTEDERQKITRFKVILDSLMQKLD